MLDGGAAGVCKGGAFARSAPLLGFFWYFSCRNKKSTYILPRSIINLLKTFSLSCDIMSKKNLKRKKVALWPDEEEESGRASG